MKLSDKLKIKILELGLDVPEEGDRTGRILCPYCNGGDSNELSFGLVRVTNGLVYNCFRASCSLGGGMVRDGHVSFSNKGRKKSKLSRPYEGPMSRLSVDYYRFFGTCFQLWPSSIDRAGWKFSEHHVVFPVKNVREENLGHILRVYDRRSLDKYGFRPEEWFPEYKPTDVKAQATYKNSFEVPFYNYYYPLTKCKAKDTVVLVEDSISALKLAQHGFHSVALLGVYMADDIMFDLVSKFKRGVVALDKDASKQTFSTTKKLNMVMEARPCLIERDLKYYGEKELCEILL